MSDTADDWAAVRMGEPARRALRNAGYTRFEALAGVTQADIADLHGMGPKTLELLTGELAARGLHFASA